jgi:hypothetical protein
LLCKSKSKKSLKAGALQLENIVLEELFESFNDMESSNVHGGEFILLSCNENKETRVKTSQRKYIINDEMRNNVLLLRISAI